MSKFLCAFFENENKITMYFIVGMIFLAIVFSLIIFFKRKNYIQNKNIIDSFPSILSTLGVLGTFTGITLGLLDFEPSKIDESITELLTGLKMAFLTSIVGMICSTLLNILINLISDKATKETTSNDQQIAKTESDKINQNIILVLQNIEKNNVELVNAINDQTSSYKKQIESLKAELKKDIEAQTKKLTERNNNYEEKLSTLGNLLINIKESIEDEGKVINIKFNEFSKVLSKNNSEALVGVMKLATETFSASMNEIIKRLVKENFEKLNDSVTNMIVWQQDNKIAMETLVAHYSEMEASFSSTSTSLKNVTNTIKDLSSNISIIVDNNGILKKLVIELQNAMMDDTNFRKVTSQLSQATQNLEVSTELITNSYETIALNINNLANKTSESINTNSKKTNDILIASEKKFTDSINSAVKTSVEKLSESIININRLFSASNELNTAITILIKELRSVSEIKEINSEFWKKTKKRLNEGLKTVNNASKQLSENLDNINDNFCSELNMVLKSLDECIRSAMEHYKKQ